MHSSKQCFKCKMIKPIQDFYKHDKMDDKHLNKCKECTKADVAKNRLANLEKIRAYDRERAKYPHRRKSAAEHTSIWKKQDSRRSAAHSAVARALRKGDLVRLPCERCGADKSYAHHENYDMQLDVMWLCQPCHKQRHKELVIFGIEP